MGEHAKKRGRSLSSDLLFGGNGPAIRPLLVFLSFLFVLFVLWRIQEQAEVQRLDLETQLAAATAQNHIESWLALQAEILTVVAEDLRDADPGLSESFSASAEKWLTRFRGFHSLAWIGPDLEVGDVYPPSAGEQVRLALMRSRDSSDFLRAIRETGMTGEVTRSHAEHADGESDVSFMALKSAFNASNELEGYLAGVVKMREMVNAAFENTEFMRHHRYSLRELDGRELLRYGANEPPDEWKHAVTRTIDGVYRPFHLTVAPKEIWVMRQLYAADDFVFLLGFVVALLLAWLTRVAIQRRQSLLNSERKLSLIYNSASDAIFLVDIAAWRIVDANSTAARILGYDADELKGLGVERIHPDHVEELKTFVRRIRLEGRRRTDDLECRCKDGRDVPVEASGSLLTMQNREYALIMARDISERKAAEEALSASERKYRDLVDVLPLAVFEGSLDGRLLFINKYGRELFGYDLENGDEGPTNLTDFIHPQDRDRAYANIQKRLEGEVMGSNEYTYHRRDGSTFPGIALTLCVEGKGSQRSIRGVVMDNSERKAAEESRRELEDKVRQAQKLESLGVLAGGIAHDFNNLLLSIIGNADITLSNLRDTDVPARHIESVIRSAERAGALCSQLLAYSGKGKFLIQPLDVSALVREMAELLEVTLSKKVKLIYDFPEEPLVVDGDPSQIRQVVMNLITNAADAVGDRNGAITVRTGSRGCTEALLRGTYVNDELPAGDYVFIQIGDSGEGMSEDTRQKIFEPFFSSKGAGRGLGLSAVLGIVRGHYGAVDVESELGKGATFTVYFPRSSNTVVEQPKAPPAETRRGAGTILLVEDDEMLRSLGKETLELAGYSVMTASDGREGLTVYQTNAQAIDVVFLDMMMPGLNGAETFREIRGLNKGVRVVLTSGYSEQEVRGRFEHDTPSAFIQKPYRASELVRVMSQVLGN